MQKLILSYFMILFITVACGSKEGSMSNEEIISGKDEKTWEATRETNAQGEKDKLTREEKKESITFSRNGTVKMSNNDQMMGGTWSFTENTLSLQFTGTNVTEQFNVTELSDDKMKLTAADGSQMTLEPK